MEQRTDCLLLWLEKRGPRKVQHMVGSLCQQNINVTSMEGANQTNINASFQFLQLIWTTMQLKYTNQHVSLYKSEISKHDLRYSGEMADFGCNSADLLEQLTSWHWRWVWRSKIGRRFRPFSEQLPPLRQSRKRPTKARGGMMSCWAEGLSAQIRPHMVQTASSCLPLKGFLHDEA